MKAAASAQRTLQTSEPGRTKMPGEVRQDDEHSMNESCCCG